MDKINAEGMRRLLAGRYSSPEWFITFEVPVNDGDGGRRIDALAISRIASRGHEVHAIEIKVNRSDWGAELKNPSKAEGWGLIADRFYVATPKGLVSPVEIPAGWGLYQPATNGLQEVVVASLNPWREIGKDPIDRRKWVFLLRRALDADESTVKVLVEKAYKDGETYGEKQGEATYRRNQGNLEYQLAEIKREVQRFEKASGIKVADWESFGFGNDSEERGRMVRKLIAGEKVIDRLDNIRRNLEGMINDIDETIAGRKLEKRREG